MAEKEIKGVRIKFRRDTESNYQDSFIPLKGEICLVDTNNDLKIKVGDGSTTFANLPFLEQDISGKQDKITTDNKLSTDLIKGLSTVATTGSYNDLANKPTITTNRWTFDEENECLVLDII